MHKLEQACIGHKQACMSESKLVGASFVKLAKSRHAGVQLKQEQAC